VDLDQEVVYHETIKREPNKRLMYECRCDERLKDKLRDLHASHTLVFFIMNRESES
jgi:hypothetical protein